MSKMQEQVTADIVQTQLGGLWACVTAEGEWVSQSEAWVDVWGSVKPATLVMLFHPTEQALWPTAVLANLSEGPVTLEVRLNHGRGQYHWYQLRVAPLKPENETARQTPLLACQFWNVDAYKQAQPDQQNEHVILLAILETSIGAIIILDTEGQITFANERAEQVLGLSLSDIRGRTYDDPLWHPTALDGGPWPDENQPFRIVMQTGKSVFNIRHAIEWPDGQRKALSINGAPLRNMNGHIDGAVFLVEDITQRLETERTLRESESLFRGIVESQIDLVSRYRADATLLYVNEAYCKFFGYQRDELIGQSFLSLVAEDEQQTVLDRLEELRQDPSPRMLITRDNGRDGRERWVQWTDYGILDEHGELYMVQAVGRDVTELKLFELALRDSQDRMETLVANLPGMVYRCENNHDWTMHYASDGAFDLTGYMAEEYVGQKILRGTLIQPEWREPVYEAVQTAIAEDRPFELVYQIQHKNGELRWVWEQGRAVPRRAYDDPAITFLEGFMTDITEQKRAEEILLQSQKAESLGVLAGGIAHDFNNLLVAILGQSSLALRRLEEDQPARKSIDKVVKAAKRASDLTRQLLAYTGQGQLQMHLLDLNELIQENIHLLQVAVSHRVSLVLELEEGLPSIMADAGQIQQIVMNLVINAAEAIGDRSGTVQITTAVCEIGPNEIMQSRWMQRPLSPGQFIKLSVVDNGSGMSEETLERIFDPFFSTKFTGRGLGLSAVAGIISRHQGGISVQSAVEEGTEFTLLFPAPAAAKTPSVLLDGQSEMVDLVEQLRGTVLVVDDEQLVREAVRDILDETALTVWEAENGYDGLALFKAHQDKIGLILLDISMPQLTGYETLKLLREIDPDVPIVLSSGYRNAQAESQHGRVANQITDFIEKPYQPQQLYRLLTRYLPVGQP